MESAPSQEARWEWRPTGVTYGSVWVSSDIDGRRELLRRSGISIAASVSGRSKSNGGAWKSSIHISDEAIAMGGVVDKAAIGRRIADKEKAAKRERIKLGIPED